MLGENPQPPRNDSKIEKMFPVEKTAPAPGIRTKAPPKKKVKKLDAPLGEKAIRRAMKKALDYKKGVPFGFIKGNDDIGLQLTLIEIYILATLCDEGMPLVSGMNADKSHLGKSMTWDDISKSLIDTARLQLQQATDLVAHCKAALLKGGSQDFKEDFLKILASNVSKAESQLAIREEAARLANDFSKQPSERLSKKRYVPLVVCFRNAHFRDAVF